MSGTASRGHTATQPAEAAVGTAPGGAPRRGRRVAVWLAVAVVLAAGGAVTVLRAGVSGPGGSSGPGTEGAPAPATAQVMRRDLSQATTVNATLGYGGSYTVRGQGSGSLTWLPSAGRVIGQGQVLYRVGNGTPVVLLYGRVPDWRAMAEGTTGADVTQLNHDLVSLGYAGSAAISALGWDYYSWKTSAAVQALEEHLGVPDPSGSLSLGSVVFEPVALRVATVPGSLGGPASGPVLIATSDRHVVTISLDAAQQSEVKSGDTVTVTLPDGSTTPGVISSVGKVASGSGSSATIPVHVTLTHPSAAGRLDQAPVTVAITTATAHGALVVPVGALLAQSTGGYAVEVTRPGNTRHLVPVATGIFDDSDGLVQVTGALTPGQRVVVPAT